MTLLAKPSFSVRPIAFGLALAFPVVATMLPQMAEASIVSATVNRMTTATDAVNFQGSQPATSAAFCLAPPGLFGDVTCPASNTDDPYASFDGTSDFKARSAVSIQRAAQVQANAAIRKTDTFRNTTGGAVDVVYNFVISNIHFDFNPVANSRPKSLLDSVSIRIFAGSSNVPVFSSGFSLFTFNLESGSPSTTVTQTGTDIGLGAAYAMNMNSFDVFNYTSSIDLGMLANDGSLDVRYELDLDSESMNYGGPASVFFDNSLSGFGEPNAPTPPNGVPEPATDLALVTGLMGMGAIAARRRRNRKA